MTNQEMVDKIVKKSGITREQAEEILEMHGGDLLEAMIYVEKKYNITGDFSSSSYSTNFNDTEDMNPNSSEAGFSESQPNFSSADFNGAFNVNEQKRTSVNESSFFHTLRHLLDLSVRNGITVYCKDSELITLPVIFWIIVMLWSFSKLLVIMFISMFFNIRYSFKGSELGKEKYNKVMFGIYEFVQNLKVKILS